MIVLAIIVLIVTFILFVYYKKKKNKRDIDLKLHVELIKLCHQYYKKLIETKELDYESSTAMDNLVYFFVFKYELLSNKQKMELESLIYPYEEIMTEYLTQIIREINGDSPLKTSEWYFIQNEGFEQLYRKILLKHYSKLINNDNLKEIENLDYKEYKTAINYFEVLSAKVEFNNVESYSE